MKSCQKTLKMSRGESKTMENNQKRFKLVKSSQKLRKTAKDGEKCVKKNQKQINSEKWSCQKRSKMGQEE